MIGSWQQESVYVGTALAELITLRLLRGGFGALAFSIRAYLVTQLAIFCVLMPLSLSGSRYYLAAYVVSSVANFAVEVGVLLGLFQELSPDGPAYGSARLWALCCLLVSVVIGSVLVLEPPSHFSPFARFYLTMDQVFTVFRNAGLFAVFFKGILCGSSWPRRVSYAWLGLAVYSFCDFLSQRLELIHSFAFHSILQFVTPLASLMMLVLWSVALHVPQRSPRLALVPHQEKSPA